MGTRAHWPMVSPNHNDLYTRALKECRDYLAMDLLGASLQGLFREANTPTMDMRSVLSIAVQVVRRAIRLLVTDCLTDAVA